MDEGIKILLNYGVLGISVVALVWYVLKRDKDDKEERRLAHEESITERKEWVEAIRNNTTAIVAIKTLLETIPRGK